MGSNIVTHFISAGVNIPTKELVSREPVYREFTAYLRRMRGTLLERSRFA